MKNDMIAVSVVVPTYKPKEYLWECLDSLYAQTLSKEQFEVIIVLNGCNEPYASQIEEYMASHSEMQFRFHQTDAPGVSNARNIALDMKTGEYVTFIDDDDYVSPTFLEGLLKVAGKETVALCNTVAFVDNGSVVEDYRISKEYQKWSVAGKQKFWKPKKYYSGPCMKLIHSEIVKDRRFDRRFKNGEDSLYMFLLSDKMKYCDFTSADSIYYRRIREGSALTASKPLSYKLKNAFKLFCSYTAILIQGFPHYNCWFYLTRIMGLVKSIF